MAMSYMANSIPPESLLNPESWWEGLIQLGHWLLSLIQFLGGLGHH